MPALGDLPASCFAHVTGATGRRKIALSGKVVFTTSGAVDTTNSDTPFVTPSKPSGTGKYRLAMPGGSKFRCTFCYHNADSTSILGVTGGAIDETNMTIDFQTFTQGATDAAANATSGDYVTYMIEGEV